MHKSVPKVAKVLTFRKVYQKIQKSKRWGSDLFWTKSKYSCIFLGGASLNRAIGFTYLLQPKINSEYFFAS